MSGEALAEGSEYDKVAQASMNGIYVKALELDRGHNAADAPSAAPPGSPTDAEAHASTHATDAEAHASAHATDAESHASTHATDTESHASTHASNK